MIDRVKKILEIEHMSPSQFADEIHLQRSSLSHVLSGRNKPSLDFVTKIKNRFSEINLEWLIFGKGNMFFKKEDFTDYSTNIIAKDKKKDNTQSQINFNTKPAVETTKSNVIDETANSIKDSINLKPTKSTAKRIIILYDDGTFDNYINRV